MSVLLTPDVVCLRVAGDRRKLCSLSHTIVVRFKERLPRYDQLIAVSGVIPVSIAAT